MTETAMILPIYTYGQPVLRKETDDIELDYPELQQLIQNMIETMQHADGVGLAAPQVGLPIRLAVIDLDVVSDDMPEYKGYIHAFINPEIIELAGEDVTMEEGCLSLPGIHESVTRKNCIHAVWTDENLVEHDEWVSGFLSRVMQHEFDHLDGHIFIDRLSSLRKQMIKGKLNNLLKGKVSCSYKVKKLRS